MSWNNRSYSIFLFQKVCYFKFMVFEEKQFTPKVEMRVKADLHDLLPDCVWCAVAFGRLGTKWQCLMLEFKGIWRHLADTVTVPQHKPTLPSYYCTCLQGQTPSRLHFPFVISVQWGKWGLRNGCVEVPVIYSCQDSFQPMVKAYTLPGQYEVFHLTIHG